MKYGILIGRFQPLHLGHQTIINEILHDGLIPVILIGSSNTMSFRNPFSYVERSQMIHSVYGSSVLTLPLPDNESNLVWTENIKNCLLNSGIDLQECTLYYHIKDGDINLLDLLAFFSRKSPNHLIEGLDISATKIRSNPELYRRYLDGRIYKYVKEKLEKYQ